MYYAETFLTQCIFRTALMPLLLCSCSVLPRSTDIANSATPEAVVRAMFQANAIRDMAELERLVSKDHDMVGYTVGGRKFVGWNELEREMQQEFEAVTHLEIPIKEIRVWERGDVAWYTAEIDYIRYEGRGEDARKTILPLRESGVMERRQGQWLLVQWHESLTRAPETHEFAVQTRTSLTPLSLSGAPIDLSGEWEIHEEDKTYHAVLDESGNGSYTWQHGVLVTTRLADGRWEGTWHQAGNDREGGFEVRLSEDGTTANGSWWYTRVGNRPHIPPRQWGGGYRLKRMNSAETRAMKTER